MCFCQNINDIETRIVEGERYRVERIVASRGFDPVACILELRVSRSTVTRFLNNGVSNLFSNVELFKREIITFRQEYYAFRFRLSPREDLSTTNFLWPVDKRYRCLVTV